MKFRRILISATALWLCSSLAQAATVVPEGNHFPEQPDIPFASSKRTAATKSSFDTKYEKVLDLLKNDPDLRGKIKKIAAQYGISPIHMVGAISASIPIM